MGHKMGDLHEFVGPDVIRTVHLGALLFHNPFRRRMSSLPLMRRVGGEATYKGSIP